MKQPPVWTRLGRMIRVWKNPSTPLWVKFLPVLALVYWISPIDIVPDPLLLIGWLDDIVIVATLLTQTIKQLDRRGQRALPPTGG